MAKTTDDVEGWERVYHDQKEVEAVLKSVRNVLRERERELLELKGPCSTKNCTLHFAHSGPCDIQQTGW